MENTLENRLIFYAQHLGQNIIINSDCFKSENGNDIIHTTLVSVSLNGIECDGWIPETEHTALELKSLSSITDEDILIIAELLPWHKISESAVIAQTKELLQRQFQTNLYREMWSDIVDKFRELGYAHKWNGVTVQEQIEYGWIKLKSQ